MQINRKLGIVALAVAMMVAGGAAYACDHSGSAKSAGCGGAKHADCATKHADCAAMAGCGEAAGHECGMKAEKCAEHMKQMAETHGWLGVGFDMDDEAGLTINKVWSGSPAEQAGFQVGDRLVSVNGVEISDKKMEKVHEQMWNAKIGDRATYVVARGSNTFTLEATLSKMPEEILSERINEHMKEGHQIAKK